MSNIRWSSSWSSAGGPLYEEKYAFGARVDCWLLRVPLGGFMFYCPTTRGEARSQLEVLNKAEKLNVTSEEEAEVVGLTLARMV